MPSLGLHGQCTHEIRINLYSHTRNHRKTEADNVYSMCPMLTEAEESVRSLVAGVTDGCELPCAGETEF